MSRPVTEDDLHAYVDGFLDDARAAEITTYLARNPEPAARVRAYAAQREALRAAFAPLAEAPIPPALNIDRMIATRRRKPAGLWRMAAAAMVALSQLGLGGTGGWMMRGAMAPHQVVGVAALSRAAAESWAIFAPDVLHPVEFRAAERPVLMNWIASRTGARIPAPDLSAAGYRFMGGRVVTTAHGAAALFMYEDRQGTRLVLLGKPMLTEDRNAPLARFEAPRVAGYSWASDGIGFSLAGPATIGANALQPLAREAERQVAGAV